MEFNYKQFKYKAFQFLSIFKMLHPNTRLGQDIDGQKALKLELKTHQNAQTEKAGKILH